MKIMRKYHCNYVDSKLNTAKFLLGTCLEVMRGKYGTHKAVREIKVMLCAIENLISKKEFYKSFYQKFRTPPNTPKSRRLGWHKKGN